MTLFDPIDAASCGCDSPIRLNGLMSIDAALARIAETVQPVAETETVPLAQARGRFLAEAVSAKANVPPFDNAAMDGYALASAALPGDGPWRLPVAGRIAAGEAGTGLAIGSAARIFTGAPLPPGADAVVMQEDVTRLDGTITLRQRPTPGQNIRRAGEDMAAGAEVLPTGRRLGARDIAACAAAGMAEIMVRRRLRAALLVTGDEIRQAGKGLSPAQIWDVNTPMLTACLSTPELDLIAVEHGADTPLALRAQLARLAESADVIVTTGGISVGEEDHVKPALAALGGSLRFSGVAIKPGKPVSFGSLGRALWLGLPGNPVSALVTWQIFGSALLRALAGQTQGPGRRHVTLAAPIRRKPGRCELRPARLAGFDVQGREVAHCALATHSARVGPLPEADGLLFLPGEIDRLPAGALVEFLPFDAS